MVNYKVFAADDDGLYSALVARGTPAALTYERGVPAGAHPSMAAIGYHPMYFTVRDAAVDFVMVYCISIMQFAQVDRVELWAVEPKHTFRSLPRHSSFSVNNLAESNGSLFHFGKNIKHLSHVAVERCWPRCSHMARQIVPLKCIQIWQGVSPF